LFYFYRNLICTKRKRLYICTPKGTGTIAQLVEQRTENPCVAGSIPAGTTRKGDVYIAFFNGLNSEMYLDLIKLSHQFFNSIVVRDHLEVNRFLSLDDESCKVEMTITIGKKLTYLFHVIIQKNRHRIRSKY
jgi:hypothetical protein